MNLSDIKSKFDKGLITKQDFIEEMYKNHSQLFEYSKLLHGNGISRIEISDQAVIMSMKPVAGEGEIKIKCVTNDKRTTALEILNFGNYEEADASMLFKMTDKNYTVFDIGANIGWYALNFSTIIKHGSVYSFEPIPETHEILNNNIIINNATNIKTFNIALSDKDGETEFFYNPDELGASSARNIKELSQIKKIKCITKKLDSFVDENKIKNLDLIKCDVEGGELFVFEGGLETIKKFTPIIFTEMLRKWSAKFNYHPNRIIKYFSDIDYKCFVVSSGKIREIKEVTDETTETNFIFLQPSKHGEKIGKYS